jgi:membrane-bound serine protease (ClpP class)
LFELLAQAAGSAPAPGWESSLALATFLVALGLAFIVAEIFIVSFGLLTVCSIASLVGAVIIAFNAGPGWGITFIVIEVIMIPVMIIGGFKALPRTSWGRRLMPDSPKGEDVTATGVDAHQAALMGKEGRTMSMCRPAGIAEIDGVRRDVVSEGVTILADRPVKVIQVEGNRVVVREID